MNKQSALTRPPPSFEHWKRCAALGFILALTIIVRYAWTGEALDANIMWFDIGLLGIAGGWQMGKRFTHWDPKEQAEADRIRECGCDGMGDHESHQVIHRQRQHVESVRHVDEYDAEFTP